MKSCETMRAEQRLAEIEKQRIEMNELFDIISAYLKGSVIQVNQYGVWHDRHYSTSDLNFYGPFGSYRIKPLDPMVINWDVIDTKFKWAARDKSGKVYIYTTMPEFSETQWFCGGTHYQLFGPVNPVISTGSQPWESSLITRPGVV